MKSLINRFLKSSHPALAKEGASKDDPTFAFPEVSNSFMYIEEFQVEINSFFHKTSEIKHLLEQLDAASIDGLLDEILYYTMDLQRKLTRQSLCTQEQSHKDFVAAVSWHIADSVVEIPYRNAVLLNGLKADDVKNHQITYIQYFLCFQQALEEILQTYNAFPEPIEFYSYEDYIKSISRLSVKPTA